MKRGWVFFGVWIALLVLGGMATLLAALVMADWALPVLASAALALVITLCIGLKDKLDDMEEKLDRLLHKLDSMEKENEEK